MPYVFLPPKDQLILNPEKALIGDYRDESSSRSSLRRHYLVPVTKNLDHWAESERRAVHHHKARGSIIYHCKNVTKRNLKNLFRKIFFQARYSDKSKLSLVFQKQRGFPRGKAITNYLMIATNQATYGVELFRGVHDKNKHEWVVGVCYNGIHRYHVTSLDHPDKTYDWKNLDNLYFKVNISI